MQDTPTTRERVVAIETDVRWIRQHLAKHEELETRVSRLERLGAAVTAVFSLVGFWISNKARS